MTSKALPIQHRGPRNAVALVRRVLGWLLVAVLAIDLVTSPLHAHRHNDEWSAGGTLTLSSAHADVVPAAGGADGGAHVEHDDAPQFSHSIVALRSVLDVEADVQPPENAPDVAPWYVPASRWPAELADALRRPDRHRAGSSAFRSLPPEGRAPPVHA